MNIRIAWYSSDLKYSSYHISERRAYFSLHFWQALKLSAFGGASFDSERKSKLNHRKHIKLLFASQNKIYIVWHRRQNIIYCLVAVNISKLLAAKKRIVAKAGYFAIIYPLKRHYVMQH